MKRFIAAFILGLILFSCGGSKSNSVTSNNSNNELKSSVPSDKEKNNLANLDSGSYKNSNFYKIDGENLFKSKCASCHLPKKDGAGPKLFKVREKWNSGGALKESIYEYVINWQNAERNDPYVKIVTNSKPTTKPIFPDLNKDQIEAIFDYVDSQ
jgi:mono/diheme cytochrome c family protein